MVVNYLSVKMTAITAQTANKYYWINAWHFNILPILSWALPIFWKMGLIPNIIKRFEKQYFFQTSKLVDIFFYQLFR